MPITKEPPCKALELGSSLRNNQTQNGPTAVSSNINIPTSAAGIRIGPMVIKVKANGPHNQAQRHHIPPTIARKPHRITSKKAN